MVWIKICGITNLPDAETAIALGADAVGFVFAPSKREVTPDLVRKITRALPPKALKIGVFANQEISLVRAAAEYCGLTGVQLHGDEPPAYCASLGDFEVIKAFRVNSQIDADKIKTYIINKKSRKILFDTYMPKTLGGTGKTFNWELAANQKWIQVPLIIAGGLNADNVVQAIRLASPFGVDVSSGVEKAPGQKDLFKLKTFIENARGL